MRILTNGNVGIATTSPSNLLSIKGSGQNWNTSPAMKLWDSTYSKGWYVGTANNQAAGDYYIRSVTSESAYPVSADQQFTIKQNGNVGIGTIAPSSKLHVYHSTNASDTLLMVDNRQTSQSGADYNKYGIQGIARGSDASWSRGVGISGMADAATFHKAIGVYAGLTTSPASGFAHDTALFADGNNLGYAGTFMNGNVGIGVTDPDYPLEVKHNSNTLGIKITGGTSAANNSLVLNNTATSGVAWDITSTGGGHGYGNGDLNFGIGFAVPKVQFKNNGNVGIGNFGTGTAPQSLLHIQGTNNSAGDLYTAVGVGNCPGISIGNTGTTDNNNAALYFRNDGGERASIGARFVSHSNEKTELRFSTTNGSGATRERVRINGDGVIIATSTVSGSAAVNHFEISKTFSATGSSVTRHEINLINEIGATTAGNLHYQVSVGGYGSGGANGVNATYSVAGYSGHSWSASNHGSMGAGTIQNGYDSSNSTSYDAKGLSYHPCINMGSYIQNGQVWAYNPAGQRYGFTISNNSSTAIAICITVRGWYR